MAKLYYEADADAGLIAGRKVAIIGYGSQGHAHALNLADSGIDVRVGPPAGVVLAGTRPRRPASACCRSPTLPPRPTSIMMLLPDTEQAAVYESEIAPHLSDGDALFFAHGFNIRFGQIAPAARRRRGHGGAEGTRTPRAAHLHRGRRRAVADRRGPGRLGQGA